MGFILLYFCDRIGWALVVFGLKFCVGDLRDCVKSGGSGQFDRQFETLYECFFYKLNKYKK